MTLKLMGDLALKRCPHCGVDSPSIPMLGSYQTKNFDQSVVRQWGSYACKRCGGAIIASSTGLNDEVLEFYPPSPEVDGAIPGKARSYLSQALNSLSAPAGAVMLTASAVDAMLKEKEYIEGSLYSRIDAAVNDNIITLEMARWAHEIRLDANDERHADYDASMATSGDADKVIDFALALAEFMFVLPAKIQRGLGN